MRCFRVFTFKCKMCGATLNVSEGERVCTCDFCDSLQTVPGYNNQKKIDLFSRANELWFRGLFDEARNYFNRLVIDYKEESEGYWGLCLCRYGVRYVYDEQNDKRVPVCYRTQIESIMDDPDYISALKNSVESIANVHRKEALYIDNVQHRIREIALNSDPYDIFLCYKPVNEDGIKTSDSKTASIFYEKLSQRGLRVFASDISLVGQPIMDREACLFQAIQTAKVMILIISKSEYADDIWVRNDWERFIKLDDKLLMICCYGIDPNQLPESLRNLKIQADIVSDEKSINEAVRKAAKSISKTTNRKNINYDSIVSRIDIRLSYGESDLCPKTLPVSSINLDDSHYINIQISLKANPKDFDIRVELYDENENETFLDKDHIKTTYIDSIGVWVISGNFYINASGKHRIQCFIDSIFVKEYKFKAFSKKEEEINRRLKEKEECTRRNNEVAKMKEEIGSNRYRYIADKIKENGINEIDDYQKVCLKSDKFSHMFHNNFVEILFAILLFVFSAGTIFSNEGDSLEGGMVLISLGATFSVCSFFNKKSGLFKTLGSKIAFMAFGTIAFYFGFGAWITMNDLYHTDELRHGLGIASVVLAFIQLINMYILIQDMKWARKKQQIFEDKIGTAERVAISEYNNKYIDKVSSYNLIQFDTLANWNGK